MMTLRKSNERGQLKIDWLNAKHSFSFGSYFDPKWMGVGHLRVINEDIIAENGGFDTHPHRNMEIISFVIEGEIEHKDSKGHQEIIGPGEIQIMSAGKGIYHSEFNPSSDKKTKMLQIWIEPNVKDTEPSYQKLDYGDTINGPVLLASPDFEFGKGRILQDAKVYYANYHCGDWHLDLDSKRKYWIQVVSGDGQINNTELEGGDGLFLEDEKECHLKILKDESLKFLLFELV